MSVAKAVAPFPPSFDVTALVVLFCVPEAVPVTLTEKEQEVFADRVAAERLTLLDPPTAAIVPPPQFPLNPFGVATNCPDGKASVKPMPLRLWLVFGFDRLKLRLVVPCNAILAAPNDLVIVGGITVGGGVDPAEDPPPHPRLEKRLTAQTSTKSRDVSSRVRVIRLNAVTGSVPNFPCPVLHMTLPSSSGSFGDTKPLPGPWSF